MPCERSTPPKQAALAERLRRAEAAVEREQQQASQPKLQTALSVGATLLGALLGRKAISAGTLGRATTAARGVGADDEGVRGHQARRRERRGCSAQADRARGRDPAETQAHRRRASRPSAARTGDSLAPKRGQVTVQFVALGWVPVRGAPARDPRSRARGIVRGVPGVRAPLRPAAAASELGPGSADHANRRPGAVASAGRARAAAPGLAPCASRSSATRAAAIAAARDRPADGGMAGEVPVRLRRHARRQHLRPAHAA